MMDLVLVSALGMGIVALGFLIYTASLVRLVRLMRAVSDRKTEELKLQMRQLRSYSQSMYEDFRNSSRNESVKWATIFDEDPFYRWMQTLSQTTPQIPRTLRAGETPRTWGDTTLL